MTPETLLSENQNPMQRLLAIDPGTTHSGYVLLDGEAYPIRKGKVPNEELIFIIRYAAADVVIEMVSSYGKPVGR